MRRTFIALLNLVVAGFTAANAADRPNILIFYVDDMAWAQPSAYGGRLAVTPNIDAIAKEGVRFTNGYSSGCICSPGRVGLMTGRYQARTGHDANPAKPGRELLLSEVTMAQRLKAAGYHTGIVGKWHLGDTGPEFMPPARGFDFAMGTTANLGEGGSHPFYRGSETLKELEGAPITSPIFAREACTYIESQKDKPWFLYLSFNAVHSPIVASPHWLEKFQHLDKREAAYAALVSEADEAVGTVMTKLRELKLEDDTLIFLISDNGGANALSDQAGLRGSKWYVWEGGIRVSWMVQWKGRIPAGRVVSEPVIQLDVLPTSLAAAEMTAPSEVPLDGVNLLPLLEGKTDKLESRPLYFRFGVQHAIREGDWKLVKASKEMQPMLVNLLDDPGETTDATTQHPDIAAALAVKFDQWNAKMMPPRWEDARWNGDRERKTKKSRVQTNTQE